MKGVFLMAVSSEQQRSPESPPENDVLMSTLDHLGELRRRIIYVLLFFVVSLVIGFIFSPSLVEVLKNDPVAEDVPWNVFKITDSFRVYLQFSFVLSLVITIPFLLYQVYAFLKPALTQSERRAVYFLLPLSLVLFVTGLAFGYFVLFPLVLNFMGTITETMGAHVMYGIAEYFSFLLRLILPVALLFELPVVVMFLTKLGLINPVKLRKMRKIALLVFAVLSALVTPPDIISQVLVLIPLMLLYELSIGLSALVHGHK